MEGINLKIACLNHPPYVVVNETEQGRWELSGGIDAFVIKLLQQKYCFTYEIIVPPDKDWGKLLGDRWTGITGMVNRNEVDLGIANLMFTEKRYDAVAFSVPYSVDGFAMVSLAPRTSENTGAVLQPFQTELIEVLPRMRLNSCLSILIIRSLQAPNHAAEREVWCAIFASVLIISCLLSGMQKIQSCYRMTPVLTWRNTLWNVFATLCQEGVKLSTMKGATVGFFCMWIMSTFVLQVSYGGTLIGFLTFPNQEPSIATLEDLASAITKRNVKIAFKFHSLAESLLVGNVKHGRLFQETINRVSGSKVRTHEEGFYKVLMENFVFFANKFGCTYDSFRGDFEKLQMHDVFQANYIGVAASKNFKYLKEFNIVLRRLTERGLIAKWRSDILARRMIDVVFSGEVKGDETEFQSKSYALTINHLQGAFILLTVGHSVATLILISELFCRRAVNKSPSESIRKISNILGSDITSKL